MVQLFGKEYSRKQLLSFTGNIAQLGGIRPVELVAGRERGVRGFDINTGSGLEITALADRAFDITRATFRGRSLVYHSPYGQAHPSYFSPSGAGWLQSFPGGLLTTCGLRSLGSPSTDDGEDFGLHGRVSNLPMEECGYWGEWHGDEYQMQLTGTLTEGSMFKSSLRMTRRLSAQLGGNSIVVDDTVENIGGEATPHMILYHCNFGFPLLAPEAELIINSHSFSPRDVDARQGMAEYNRFQTPTPGYAEQVFYHQQACDNAGDVRVALANRQLDGGLGVYLRYRKDTLPQFVQWKQMGYGGYVLGLEPANCLVNGRAAAREDGTLPILQAGEVRHYQLEIGVLDGQEQIDDFAQIVAAQQ